VSALRHRNFRLFIFGQGISVIGTWLTKLATSWMAYRLTGSAFVLGVVAFCNSAPASLLAPLAGVLVDRWDRRRAVIATQIAAMVQSALLAAFALSGTMTVELLTALGVIQGAINAFDMPARQSFLRQMIDDPRDLPNAIAVNSSMVNVGRLVGPVAAAVLVGAFGEGWCFAIDATTYLAVLASLVAMRIAAHPVQPRTRARVRDDFVAGLRYVWSVPRVRAVLVLLAVTSVLAGSYQSIMPVVAAQYLDGGPHTLGILMAAAGIGALVAALYLASRDTTAGLDRLLARSVVLLGFALCGLKLARSIYVVAPMICVAGACLMFQMAATNTIVQTTVDPACLGRVMSLYAIALFGGMPIGAFVEGTIAEHAGAVHTLLGAGVACLAAAIVYSRTLDGDVRATVVSVPPGSSITADVSRGKT
jgi:MFS family permease